MPELKVNNSLDECGDGKYRITIAIDTSLVQSEISGRLTKQDQFISEGSDPADGDVKNEIINDLIRTSFEDAVLTYGLTPASAPSIKVLSDDNESFVFAATFDAAPTIDLTRLSTISLKIPAVEVTNNDLDSTIASLLNQSPDKEVIYESLGIKDGGEEAFRREVMLNLQREADLCESEIVKQNVFSCLSDAFKIAIPESMIISEIERVKSANKGTNIAVQSEPELRLKSIHRLKRNIIIRTVVQEIHISLHPHVVRQHIEKIATAYERPQEVIQYYYSNRVELAGIEAKVIEELVIDWLIGECPQSTYKISFTDAVNMLKQQE